MNRILCIESATKNCSVGLAQGTELISLHEESAEKYIHAERLHVLISEALAETGIATPDAIAISRGPGSYTGLRIGTAAAKGLCFAWGIPLIAIDTLDHLGAMLRQDHPGFDYYIPMIDARRMEVYTAQYASNGDRVTDVRALVIDENSFSDLEGKCCIGGDGADKCTEILANASFTFIKDVLPSARGMALLAEEMFQRNEIVDPAYFEPFYLKDFVAGKPKPLI